MVYNTYMGLFDFLKKPAAKKTLQYGQAVGNVLRRKVGEKLAASERRAALTILTPQEAIAQELFKNIQQFQAIRNNRRAIGFLSVDFFLSKAWQRNGASLKLSDEQKTTLDRAYGFLSQCNGELEGMEVRKDGFVKGQLSDPLLESGTQVLQEAINSLQKLA